jgi:phytoene synthase
VNDRDLVRLHWPLAKRPAFDALFAIDDAMAEVVISATQPALAAIKLAWWREALEQLDSGPAPPEPRLQAGAERLLPGGVRGADLATLEAGWAALLHDDPDLTVAVERGATLFRLAAGLLGDGPVSAELEAAGRLYARGNLGRRGLLKLPCAPSGERIRIPTASRPLTGLAALAARDLQHGGPPWEPEATPGRSWTLLRHRLTGVI